MANAMASLWRRLQWLPPRPVGKVLLQAYRGVRMGACTASLRPSPRLPLAPRLPECRPHRHWHQGLVCCNALASPGSGGQSPGLRMFTGSAPAINTQGRAGRKQGGKRSSQALKRGCLPQPACQLLGNQGPIGVVRDRGGHLSAAEAMPNGAASTARTGDSKSFLEGSL